MQIGGMWMEMGRTSFGIQMVKWGLYNDVWMENCTILTSYMYPLPLNNDYLLHFIIFVGEICQTVQIVINDHSHDQGNYCS